MRVYMMLTRVDLEFGVGGLEFWWGLRGSKRHGFEDWLLFWFSRQGHVRLVGL